MKFTSDVIQTAYENLGYTKGSNFLACRSERLRDASVAIVGLNPGGGGDDDPYTFVGVPHCENNSFCEDESKMRDQVREWHRVLKAEREETLCAQFIPFRSPDMKRLHNKGAAIAFARELWSEVLEVSPATLFLVMGKEAAWHLADLLSARPVARNLPTGWVGQTIDVYDSPDGRRVVAMPHPSRFKLFGRGEISAIAEESLRAAVGA